MPACQEAHADQVEFHDDFAGPPALITNEYAVSNPGDPAAVVSPDWRVTSGSLFRRDDAAWSGAVDPGPPDATSSLRTGSAVLRFVTVRQDFGDVRVDVGLTIDAMGSTERTPPVDWDGVHLFVRYHGEAELYAVSVARRDGHVEIKRKLPGGPSNGGTYTTLAEGVGPAIDPGTHHLVETETVNRRDEVVIRLRIDGQDVLVAHDHDPGPLTAPGAVGVRGDNTDFQLDHFAVRPAG